MKKHCAKLSLLLLQLLSPTLVKCQCDTGPDALAFVPAPQTCIELDGLNRCWYTYTPPEISEAVPLVLDLHGYTSCAQDASIYTGWRQKAVDEFVLVWPQGSAPPGGICWDAGTCCCYEDEGDGTETLDPIEVDDTLFIKQVISDVVAASNVPIDTTRIYLVGHSNGCMMVQKLASELSSIVAAVGCHAGVNVLANGNFPGTSESYKATPIITIHGDADETVPYEGLVNMSGEFISAEDNISRWASANGCEGDPIITVDDSGKFARHIHSGCIGDSTVELVQMYGVGHVPYNFPNLGQTDIDTTQIAKDFIFQYSRLEPTQTPSTNPSQSPSTNPSQSPSTNPSQTPSLDETPSSVASRDFIWLSSPFGFLLSPCMLVTVFFLS